MPEDEELKGLIKIIKEHTKEGMSLNQIAVKLEKEGFAPEKLQQAIIVAGEEPTKTKVTHLFEGALKPLLIYSGIFFVFLLIIFLFVKSLLDITLKIPFATGTFIIMFIVLYVLGLIGYVISGFLFRFCAFLFVKDYRVNTIKNAFWLMLISFSASLYLGLVIFLSFKASNVVWFFIILVVITFIFQLTLISFIYKISVTKSLLLAIVYSIAQQVLSWIITFILWVLVYLFFGVMFASAPSIL